MASGGQFLSRSLAPRRRVATVVVDRPHVAQAAVQPRVSVPGDGPLSRALIGWSGPLPPTRRRPHESARDGRRDWHGWKRLRKRKLGFQWRTIHMSTAGNSYEAWKES